MSPDLPFDIIAIIVDIVGEKKDIDLLKKLSLVSHSFLQICSKHLFATVQIHDVDSSLYGRVASKKAFIKLLKRRPDVVKYIRTLTYKVGHTIKNDNDLHLTILTNFLPTISPLNCLKIDCVMLDWNELDSSLTSALLHLMHLPTINHIDLSYIKNFPLSSLTPSVNLHRLDISYLSCPCALKEDGSPIISVLSEMMPKIREFHTSYSSGTMTRLLHAKIQDGQPAFDLTDLRRLTISFLQFEDEWNIRYLLQNTKLLEELCLSVDFDQSFVGLVSPSARTLKVLELFVLFDPVLPLAGLCEELEAMAGHNVLEALSLEVYIDLEEDAEGFIGSKLRELESVLVKPGWSTLRQVSIKVTAGEHLRCSRLAMALQSLPDKYLSHLSKLESVFFNYSAGFRY